MKASRQIRWFRNVSLHYSFLLLFISTAAVAQPTFTKVFTPDTIGPGSTTTLVFTIDNTSNSNPVTDLAFTDILKRDRREA